MDLSLPNNVQQKLESKIAELEAMISWVPGVHAPIKKHHLQSYADFPFSEEICMIEMPSRFTYPTIRVYDGNGDPDDHIAKYKRGCTRLQCISSRERLACARGVEPVWTSASWFINPPNESISSFVELHDLFVEQFSSSRKIENRFDDMYTVKQRADEPLQEYVARFNQEKATITNYNFETMIIAFQERIKQLIRPLQRAHQEPVFDHGGCRGNVQAYFCN